MRTDNVELASDDSELCRTTLIGERRAVTAVMKALDDGQRGNAGMLNEDYRFIRRALECLAYPEVLQNAYGAQELLDRMGEEAFKQEMARATDKDGKLKWQPSRHETTLTSNQDNAPPANMGEKIVGIVRKKLETRTGLGKYKIARTMARIITGNRIVLLLHKRSEENGPLRGMQKITFVLDKMGKIKEAEIAFTDTLHNKKNHTTKVSIEPT